MINKISIKNFKSLAETSVELGPFTVLVGANGSGKSSFLQAIGLISWAVRFPSLQNALDEHQIEFRDLVHLRSPHALIECQLGLTVQIPAFGNQPVRGESVEMFIDLAKKRYPYLRREELYPPSFRENPLAKSDDLPFAIVSQKKCRFAIESPLTGGIQSRIEHQNVALGHSMLRDVSQAKNAKSQFPVLYQVARLFMDYVHYEIWGPDHLRKPTANRENAGLNLGKSGANLPGLLWRIRKSEDDRWAALVADLRESFPNIRDIVFRKGIQPGELGLEFTESTAGGKSLRYRPSQMSDGFMRLLALLAVKHQSVPLPLLGYEEPENGLHPAALDDCMRHLKAIANRGTQVIMTTHSPYLLNQLLEDQSEPRAELRLVIRDELTGNTRIVPPDPAKIARARKQGFGIGELWGMLLNEKDLAEQTPSEQ